MDKNIICNNCGKEGHLFNQCKIPITSYGIILFRYINNQYEYLMVRRKNSFGFIDFIRGKYNINNVYYLQNMIDEMSNEEKKNIINEPFDKLWNKIISNYNNSFKNEKLNSKKNFELLKSGLMINNKLIKLNELVNNSITNFNDTEWEFPKGRRNLNEKDIDCAKREFQEETGISYKYINIIDNILPFEELFIGTNLKSYKYKYYIAFIDKNINLNYNNYQLNEISKIEWKNIDECLNIIRPYNLEKKQLIININNVLEQYSLYT